MFTHEGNLDQLLYVILLFVFCKYYYQQGSAAATPKSFKSNLHWSAQGDVLLLTEEPSVKVYLLASLITILYFDMASGKITTRMPFCRVLSVGRTQGKVWRFVKHLLSYTTCLESL